MTRSTSSLGLSKNNQRSTRPSSKSVSSSSSRSHSPKPLKSPTINFYSFNPINRDLNDILRNFVDELCDVFIKARQDGKNEAQTVVIIANFTSSKDQELSQIYDWLLNNTHKDKYKTLLGYFYDQGVATKRNQRKAYCLYLSAAKKGYPIAEDLLGDCYYSGQGTTRDRDMAFEWYQKAANNGSTGSQFSLGICYAFGEGTSKDVNKAFQCYKKSANGGNASGMNELGYCYEVGIGTRKDNRKAFLLFEQAAKGGNPPGQHNLASCYEEGKGTEEDLDKAIYWYKMSADNGHEVAKQRVQSLLNLISYHPHIEDSLSSKGVDMNLLNNQIGELNLNA